MLRLQLNGAAKCLVTLNGGRPLGVFKPCPTADDITICGSIHTPSSVIGLSNIRGEGRGGEGREGEGVKGGMGKEGGRESCGRRVRSKNEMKERLWVDIVERYNITM